MPRVVFDSSFLMAVVARPTAWREDMTEKLGGFEPVVLDCVLAEMDSLSAGRGRRSRSAAVAKGIASGFRVVKSGGGDVDDEIASYALSNAAAVATLDRGLISTLKARGVRIITLRAGRVALA